MFLENNTLKQIIVPADFSAGDIDSQTISLSHGSKVVVVVSVGDSVGANNLEIAVNQHIGAAGAVEPLILTCPIHKKVGAATKFTQVPAVDIDPSGSWYGIEDADFVAAEGVIVFDIDASDLNLADGYDHVSVSVLASGTAKTVSAVAIVADSAVKPSYSVDV